MSPLCLIVANVHMQYLKVKKPTGNATCPPEVKRAYQLESLINERAGTRDLSDSDIDCTGSESSDIEFIDHHPDVIHTAVAQRAPTPPLSRAKRNPSQLVDKLSHLFDPETQKARDEERSNRSAQNTQLFTLSQQLRDAHTSSESLRNQISVLQQQLNDAERSRDVALLRVEMMGTRGGGGGGGRRRERSRSRSRGIRCEARYPDGGACTYWASDPSDSDEKENTIRRRRQSPGLSRTQIYYTSRSPAVALHRPRSPSPGPSRPWNHHRSHQSPSPVRPVTPANPNDTSTSLNTGTEGVELTVTPNRGGMPLSLIISAPQVQNNNAEH
jgi:hypothetical protein